MADVDGGREAGAEERGGERADAVGGQRRAGRKGVARRLGVATNACAVMTMPIQSTIAMPASMGTAQAIQARVPVRQTTVKKAALSTE